MHRKKRKKLINNHKPKLYFVILVYSLLICFVCLKNLGVMDFIAYQNTAEELDIEIRDLTKKLTETQHEINRLIDDEEYKENIARQENFFAKPGERIYSIKSIKSIQVSFFL